jgi:hypothetical protein
MLCENPKQHGKESKAESYKEVKVSLLRTIGECWHGSIKEDK